MDLREGGGTGLGDRLNERHILISFFLSGMWECGILVP